MAFSIGHLLTAAGQGATGYLQGKTEADRRREERERQARQEAMQQSMFDYRRQQDDAARRQQELTNKRLAEAAARAQAAADRQVEDDDREKTAAARGEASENELAAYYARTYPDKIPHGGVLPARQAIKIGEAEDAEARLRSRPERPTVGAANAARSARYQDAVGRAGIILQQPWAEGDPELVLKTMTELYPEMAAGELNNAVTDARGGGLRNERTAGLIAGKSPGAPSAVDAQAQRYKERMSGVDAPDAGTPTTDTRLGVTAEEYAALVAEHGEAKASRYYRITQ